VLLFGAAVLVIRSDAAGLLRRLFSALAASHDAAVAAVAQRQLREAIGHKQRRLLLRAAAAFFDAMARCIALAGPA
jgi:hypothetical protein